VCRKVAAANQPAFHQHFGDNPRMLIDAAINENAPRRIAVTRCFKWLAQPAHRPGTVHGDQKLEARPTTADDRTRPANGCARPGRTRPAPPRQILFPHDQATTGAPSALPTAANLARPFPIQNRPAAWPAPDGPSSAPKQRNLTDPRAPGDLRRDEAEGRPVPTGPGARAPLAFGGRESARPRRPGHENHGPALPSIP